MRGPVSPGPAREKAAVRGARGQHPLALLPHFFISSKKLFYNPYREGDLAAGFGSWFPAERRRPFMEGRKVRLTLLSGKAG